MIAENYQTLLVSLNRAFDRLEADLAVIQDSERRLFPNSFRNIYPRERILGERYDFASQREGSAKHVFGELLKCAEKQFAPSGARLNIDATRIERHFKLAENAYLNFDPTGVWAYLQNEYGTKGEAIAYTQAADPIMRQFGIKPDHEIKTIGGQIVLERRVWIDTNIKKLNRKNILCYTCGQELQGLCSALSTFASWAGDEDLASALLHFAHSNRTNASFISRTRWPLGSGCRPPMMVVTFATRFEYRFSPELGLKLQEFLGLYASQLKAAA